MSFLYEPRPFTTLSKFHAVADVLERAKPDRDYYVLLIGATLLAVGAILTDSIPVLIASMVVAPLSAPILALGLGIATGRWKVAWRAFSLLVLSSVIALGIAMAAAIILQNDRVPDILISFNSSRVVAFLVAVISGIIAAYGTMRPKVGSAATGIAIAVSLMPPLVATGIGLAPGGTPFAGALSLYLLNIAGIAASSALTFAAFGMKKVIRLHFGRD